MADPSLAEQLKTLQENADVFFLLVISFIVFFLQGGFAFLEVGSVRSKNATNILIKNMLDVFIGGIAFWLIGYPIAFGEGNQFLGGTYWASHNLPPLSYAHWCFQFVFAATAATIVSGSVAERCAFSAYFIYSTLLTGFVYPVVAHWAWSDEGWLAQTEYHDFAGSGVVHLTGGVSALVAAILLGPRIGRFDRPDSEIRGHSVPLAGLGGFILLFGFLAFNGGSQGAISSPGDAETVARAVTNTIISGSGGGLTVLLIYRLRGEATWSFLLTLNGALCGMVSICSGCDAQYTWGALCTGIIGGIVFLIIHYLMVKLKIDDPLDAVAVHMGGGMWGLIATPFFRIDGIFDTGGESGVETLQWNVLGLLAIAGWAGGFCLIMFGILRAVGQLRVPAEVEIKGLDILKHGESAYPLSAWYEEQYYSRFEGEDTPLPKTEKHFVPTPLGGKPAASSSNTTTSGDEVGPHGQNSFYPHHPAKYDVKRFYGPPNMRHAPHHPAQLNAAPPYWHPAPGYPNWNPGNSTLPHDPVAKSRKKNKKANKGPRHNEGFEMSE